MIRTVCPLFRRAFVFYAFSQFFRVGGRIVLTKNDEFTFLPISILLITTSFTLIDQEPIYTVAFRFLNKEEEKQAQYKTADFHSFSLLPDRPDYDAAPGAKLD